MERKEDGEEEFKDIWREREAAIDSSQLSGQPRDCRV
jgi:hypothetical protein